MRFVEVKLTPDECRFGANVGVERQVENIGKKRKPAYGARADRDWQYHSEGALKEMAFAKWANLYWNGNLGQLSLSDVGQKFEVRGRPNHANDLIIRTGDPVDKFYILVTGLNGHYRIQGWISGEEGKNEAWFGNHFAGRPPMYMVPKSALRDMKELPIEPVMSMQASENNAVLRVLP